MKKYKFELVIEEGNDEFWESLEGNGCNEVQDAIETALDLFEFSKDKSQEYKLTLLEYTRE